MCSLGEESERVRQVQPPGPDGVWKGKQKGGEGGEADDGESRIGDGVQGGMGPER